MLKTLSNRELVKTLLHTQLKQNNQENRLDTTTKCSKEDFIDTVFQHFVDELNVIFLCLCGYVTF